MTNSLSTIPINRLNSNELNEKINTSVEEKANIDLSNTSFANLKNVNGTLTWGGNALLNSSSLKTINNNSLVGSGNISITSSPISALCTTIATTSSTASSTKPAVVIQNYKNGNSWYRVWSDGFIEQGGVTAPTITGNSIDKTVTFSKSFTQVPMIYAYIVAPQGIGYDTIRSSSTTNFVYHGQSASGNYQANVTKLNWYACGY